MHSFHLGGTSRTCAKFSSMRGFIRPNLDPIDDMVRRATTFPAHFPARDIAHLDFDRYEMRTARENPMTPESNNNSPSMLPVRNLRGKR